MEDLPCLVSGRGICRGSMDSPLAKPKILSYRLAYRGLQSRKDTHGCIPAAHWQQPDHDRICRLYIQTRKGVLPEVSNPLSRNSDGIIARICVRGKGIPHSFRDPGEVLWGFMHQLLIVGVCLTFEPVCRLPAKAGGMYDAWKSSDRFRIGCRYSVFPGRRSDVVWPRFLQNGQDSGTRWNGENLTD